MLGKKIAWIGLIALSGAAVAYSFRTPHGQRGVLKVIDTVFDAGTIEPGDIRECNYRLTNVGDDPLELTDPRASCGCTSVVAGKRTLAPGDTTVLHVKFNSLGKSLGNLTKGIVISTKDDPTKLRNMTFACRIAMPENKHQTQVMQVEGIFKGSCMRCHVDYGRGAYGSKLYQADCAVCHSSPQAHAKDPLGRSTPIGDLEKIVEYGIPNTNMPAFAQDAGGPLTPDQINSLVQYVNERHYATLPALSD